MSDTTQLRHALVLERSKTMHSTLVHAWQQSPEATIQPLSSASESTRVVDAVFHEICADEALKHQVAAMLMDASMGKQVALIASTLIAQIASRAGQSMAKESLSQEGLL